MGAVPVWWVCPPHWALGVGLALVLAAGGVAVRRHHCGTLLCFVLLYCVLRAWLAALNKQRSSLNTGASPHTPLNNKTLVMATNRLVCAAPCVCTALCMHRLVCGQSNLPCSSLRSTNGSLHSKRGPAPAPPLNNKTHAVATNRLVYAPPCVYTALSLHCLVCALPCVCTALCVDSQTFLAAHCARHTASLARRRGWPPHPA